MKVGIVGNGVVGHATARCFIEHVEEVRVYDVVKEKATHTLQDALECDLIFICLPTPAKEDGSCDVSAIEKFFLEQVDVRLPDNRNYILRSTVPIGTTKRLAQLYNLINLVHSPEFLTARCAVTDAQLPARNIIGDTKARRDGEVMSEAAVLLRDLYQQRFPGVPIHLMTSSESEAVKLFQNSFFAVKVAFFNECQQYAEMMGLNWERVLAAILADGRIAHSHTKVPGPDGKYGFGPDTPNACLPKDIANFATCLANTGLVPTVAMAAIARNGEDRKRARQPNHAEFIRREMAYGVSGPSEGEQS